MRPGEEQGAGPDWRLSPNPAAPKGGHAGPWKPPKDERVPSARAGGRDKSPGLGDSARTAPVLRLT